MSSFHESKNEVLLRALGAIIAPKTQQIFQFMAFQEDDVQGQPLQHDDHLRADF